MVKAYHPIVASTLRQTVLLFSEKWIDSTVGLSLKVLLLALDRWFYQVADQKAVNESGFSQYRQCVWPSLLFLVYQLARPCEKPESVHADFPQLSPFVCDSGAPMGRNIVGPVKSIGLGEALRTKMRHGAVLERRGYPAFALVRHNENIESVGVIF